MKRLLLIAVLLFASPAMAHVYTAQECKITANDVRNIAVMRDDGVPFEIVIELLQDSLRERIEKKSGVAIKDEEDANRVLGWAWFTYQNPQYTPDDLMVGFHNWCLKDAGIQI